MEKVGHYDWIIDFEHIKDILTHELERYENQSCQRSLVVGCGTSLMSLEISKIFSAQVISVDNDPSCISYMNSIYKSRELMWFVCDMNDRSSIDEVDQLAPQSFSLVFDKGFCFFRLNICSIIFVIRFLYN